MTESLFSGLVFTFIVFVGLNSVSGICMLKHKKLKNLKTYFFFLKTLGFQRQW